MLWKLSLFKIEQDALIRAHKTAWPDFSWCFVVFFAQNAH